MQTQYADGQYWTHSTYGPSVQAAWRKTEILNGLVRVVEPVGSAETTHWFNQPFFFDVNTMVGPVEVSAPATEPGETHSSAI